MRKVIRGAAVGALFVVLTACVSGPVENKRAAGSMGEKTYQIEVGDPNPLAPRELWITVTQEQWENCQIEEHYPECRR